MNLRYLVKVKRLQKPDYLEPEKMVTVDVKTPPVLQVKVGQEWVDVVVEEEIEHVST